MISLPDFIERERKAILAAWEEHARTLLPPQPATTELLLRDHITELLDAIVADLRGPQTPNERSEKSKGRGARGPLDRVGTLHTQSRGEIGLRLSQIVSEYRALRSSVLMLWEQAGGGAEGVGRFNEAIDQVLAATIEHFTTAADRYRDQSLGILGHDLRNPLNAVIAGATLLAGDTLTDAVRHEIAGRVVASGTRMNRMIEDLLDLTRTRFGDAIPIAREPLDLEALCRQLVAEHASQHAAGVRFVSRGDLRGEWDPDRLAQVISNLLRNAIDHGSPAAPVTLTVEGRRDDVVLEVRNRGPAIPEAALGSIFDPLVRGRVESSKHPGLGLGLYIAWHVVEAHGGDIHVSSSDEDGTRFTVRLPKRARAEAHAQPS